VTGSSTSSAELPFREYSFDEKSFIIYGVGRSTVTKVFEGASMPLDANPSKEH
jgi:hypothetical protein